MDHWQLFTFSLLAFNFVATGALSAILTRAARHDHSSKPKRATEPRAPKLTTAEARAIVQGELHPLEAWRLGAGLSREGLGKMSKVGTETLRDVESREMPADQATQQAIIAAMLTGGATAAAQSTSSAHATAGPNAASTDGGSSGSSGSDGGVF